MSSVSGSSEGGLEETTTKTCVTRILAVIGCTGGENRALNLETKSRAGFQLTFAVLNVFFCLVCLFKLDDMYPWRKRKRGEGYRRYAGHVSNSTV